MSAGTLEKNLSLRHLPVALGHLSSVSAISVAATVIFYFILNSDLSGSCKLVHEPRLISLAHG